MRSARSLSLMIALAGALAFFASLGGCGEAETGTPREAYFVKIPNDVRVRGEYLVGVHPEPRLPGGEAPMDAVEEHLLRLTHGSSDGGVSGLLTPCEGLTSYRYAASPLFCIRLPGPHPDDPQADERVRALLSNPQVRYLQPNATVTATGVQVCPPNWGLDQIDQPLRTTAGQRVQPDGVYAYSRTGQGVQVYVADTGIEGVPEDFPPPMMAPSNTDPFGHGTMLASIVAGKKYGVAKGVTLHAIKVFDGPPSCKDPLIGTIGTVAKVAERLDSFLTDRIRRNDTAPAVLLLAFTTLVQNDEKTLQDKLKALVDRGVVVVTSAGNHKPGDPSADVSKLVPPGLSKDDSYHPITVGAYDGQGRLADFSNEGDLVDLYAPGSAIATFAPDNSTCAPYAANYSGTSMAAAFVAGVAAQILEGPMKIDPDKRHAEVRRELLKAAQAGALDGLPSAARALRTPFNTAQTGDRDRFYSDAAYCPPQSSCDDTPPLFCPQGAMDNPCPGGLESTSNCDRGVACKDGNCRSCGRKGDLCCDASKPCGKALDCNNDRCVCGGDGQQCCNGETCDSDRLVCNKGAPPRCERCGDKDQLCCGGGRCNNGTLVCTREQRCRECGIKDGPCCAGDTCDGTLRCDGDTCKDCGGAGKACCQISPICDTDDMYCNTQGTCTGDCTARCANGALLGIGASMSPLECQSKAAAACDVCNNNPLSLVRYTYNGLRYPANDVRSTLGHACGIGKKCEPNLTCRDNIIPPQKCVDEISRQACQ